MTSTIGTIAPSSNAPQQQAPAAVVTSAAATSTAAAASSANTKPLVGGSSTPISPRIVVDPLAGAITEYLTTSGQVQSQIPSAAVVAYLRAGLTSSGFAKPTPETQSENAKNGNNVFA